MNYISPIYHGIKDITYQIAETATSTALHVVQTALAAISEYFAPNAADWQEEAMHILTFTVITFASSSLYPLTTGYSSMIEFIRKIQEAFPVSVLTIFITNHIIDNSLGIVIENRKVVDTLATAALSYLILGSDAELSTIFLAATVPCGLRLATVAVRSFRGQDQRLRVGFPLIV